MAVLPPITVSGQTVVSSSASDTSNESSPSIVIDQNNANHLVAIWTRFDTQPNPDLYTVEAAYSTNGGSTWTRFGGFGGLVADPNTSNPVVPYTRITDGSVGFDRNSQVYILTSQHNDAGSSGALMLSKFDFTGAAPVPVFTNRIVHQWITGTTTGDGVFSPTMTVDDTVGSFTDPTTGRVQANTFTGNVYIAWTTDDINAANTNIYNPFNPNRIALIASSDGGQTFSGETIVSDSSNFAQPDLNLGSQRNAHPRLAISQGGISATGQPIAGGQVSVVWDDRGTLANASPPLDRIMSDSVTGAKSLTFDGPGGPIADGLATTPFTQPVSFAGSPGFNPNDLDVTLSIVHPAVNELSVELVAPNGQVITLIRNQTDAAGTTNAGIGISGANVGVLTTNGFDLGTTFTDQGTRNIVDIAPGGGRGAAAPYIGHYRPEVGSLAAFLAAAKGGVGLEGTWTLRITDFRATNAGTVRGWSLDFTQGLVDRVDSQIATTTVIGALGDTFPLSAAAAPNGIGPNVVIASDNTLGSFSPYQGRLYVSYVNRLPTGNNNPADNTDIYLATSDDGGVSWSTSRVVNDDFALTDGFSEGMGGGSVGFPGATGSAAGRPQFQPSIVVDQATGSMVMSWYDTRHDAARARVATYMTASIDGGSSFSPNVFANTALAPTDQITGQRVVLGPIPDNQSSGALNRETSFGFGVHQGLTAYAGHVYPIWSSNLNGGIGDGKDALDIRIARATIAAGPRIVDGTMGPVGEPGDGLNSQRAPDGAPLARSILVTFDRPVDPGTFTAADIQFQARDVYGNLLPAGKQPVVTSIVPTSSNAYGTTQFRVNFQPLDGSNDSIPGTISYVVGPNVSDRIRRVGSVLVPGSSGSFDAAALNPSQVNLQIPPVGTGGSGIPAQDTTVSNLNVSGFPLGQGIINVTAQINLTHTFDADLIINLISPAGTSILLSSTNGLDGANYTGTIFDDSASQSITAGSAPFAGVFQPQQALAGLNGQNPNGVWRLSVRDQFSTDTGTLLDWSLTIQTGTIVLGAVPGNFMDQDGDALPGETLNDVFDAPRRQNANNAPFTAPFVRDTLGLVIPGPHVVNTNAGTSAPGTVDALDNLARNRPNNALDVTFDRNMNVGGFTPDKVLRIMGPAGDITAPVSFGSTDTNAAIPDSAASPLISTIVINHAPNVSISDLDVRLDINHPRLSDLTVTLIAPDGTRVKLAQGVTGANFTGTTFDDEGPTPIVNGVAPYSGRFQPVESLAVLDGKPLEGTWRLEVKDSVSGQTGTLVGWSLTVKPVVNFTVTPVFNAPIFLGGATDASEFSSAPINGGATNLSSLTVGAAQGVTPGTFNIADLNVRVDLNLNATGAALNELTLTLIAPDGTRIVLLGPGQLSATNTALKNTVLDDQAAGGISDAGVAPPYTGSFKSAQALAALNGKDLSGTWQLEVKDSAGGGTRGYLRAWSLEATPQNTSTASARSFRIGFPTQQLSGTYTVDLDSSIKSQFTADAANFPNGYTIDKNLNAGVDALRQVSGVTVDKTFVSDQVPLAIPAATLAGPSVIESPLVVDENFVIQGETLQLNISFPNNPSLSAFLVAPDGTTIRLFQNVGQNGTSTDFQNTIFDDGPTGPDGRPITLIDNGNSPFNSRFRPQELLGAINGLSSVNGTGVYKLRIVNNSTTFTGTLNSWSLTLKKAVAATGLGEPNADRTSASFRIFTMDPTNELASSTWTAVGPAAIGRSSRIGAIGLDPSDSSGNTVFTAGATGGVWKTTNFLTTSPSGPTWIPLTDFGPTFAINIGSIAVFGRNNDTNQSIVFASTGDGDGGAAGVGILRSMDGGATWTLLDSTNNNLPFTSRDHGLNGNTSFNIVVDPRPTPSGEVIVYAAMSGPNGGIWRSSDTGQTWQRVFSGQATDIALDPNSGTFDAVSNPTGNLQILYAGVRGQGVFRSSNKGSSWTLLNGGIGKPLEQDGDSGLNPPPAVPVGNSGVNPNNQIGGRIVLGKPALVPSTDPLAFQKNLLYQGWLYAAVVAPSGATINLYVTKDSGQNWTLVQLPNQTLGQPAVASPFPGNPVVIPSNNTDLPDVILNTQSQYNVSLGVDPTNPNIAYVGAQTNPTMIRVDITGIHDPHAFYLDSTEPDGGLPLRTTAGGVQLKSGTRFDSPGFFDPRTTPYINLLRNPSNPVNGGSTFLVNATASIQNDGGGVRWTPFGGGALGGVDQHRMVTFRDPVTGHARLIWGYDQGIATGVDNNGVLDTGIGTAASPNGQRDGNLQINQFYYGAVQPSARDLNGQIYANLFIGSLQDNGGPRSSGDILNTGNIVWDGSRGGDAGGVGVDQQGSGTINQYFWPCCGGGNTDIFQVNDVGRTNGLFQASPDPQWPQASGSSNNIAVNPLNDRQMLISSFSGRLFRTQDQAQIWSEIDPVGAGGVQQPLDASGLRALAYGAPLTSDPFGSTDDFIYAGAYSGNLWMTTDGGNNWTNIGGTGHGMDGSSVMAVVPNPTRGSREAYAVTRSGVYHIADVLATNPQWTNVTSNLFSLTHNIFGDPDFVESRLKRGTIAALAVDWNYALPDLALNDPNALLDFYKRPLGQLSSDAQVTHPVIYVAGDGGVFRSTNDGANWLPFPSAEPNSLSTTPTPPADGGGLPYVQVNDLKVSQGKIDPTTGRAVAAPGDPNLLTAFTFGRGVFAIRLAPQVRADLLMLDPQSPGTPGGSDTGLNDGTPYDPPNNQFGPAGFRDGVTNLLNPYIAGFGEQSANGNTVYVTLYDLSDPVNPRYIGGVRPGDTSAANLARGQTDKNGRFVHVDPSAPGGFAPGVQADLTGVPDGKVEIGVQATDQSGTRGNIARFTFTLDTTPPNAPNLLRLAPSDDDGPSDSDGITNQTTNLHFEVTGLEPNSKLELWRDNGTGPVLVNSLIVGNVTPGAVVTIIDPGPLALGTYLYTVRSTDAAANTGSFSNALRIIIPLPGALPAPDLIPSDDTGVLDNDDYTARNSNLRFTVDTVDPNSKLELLRGGTVVGTVANTGAGGTIQIADAGPIPDGTFIYQVRQTDLVTGNVRQSNAAIITIDTSLPAAPGAPRLQTGDDTGTNNSDGITAISINLHFDISNIESGGKNGQVLLYRDGVQVAVATLTSGGTVTLLDPGNPDPANPGQFLALANGTYVYTARQVDRAGNAGPLSAATSITINALPLLAAPDLQAGSDSGLFNNDNVTNLTTLVFDLVGVPAGASVQLLRDGQIVLGGTRIGNGPISDNGPVPDGVHQYTLRVVDTSGGIAFSAPVSVTVDTTPPAPPAAPVLDPADDTGFSNLDRVTMVNQPHYRGTSTDADGYIVLTDASGITQLGQVVLNGTGSAQYSVAPSSPLPDGTYTLRVRAGDLAGNLSIPSSATLPIQIVTKQPQPTPTLAMVRADDTGVSNADNITRIAQPRFVGTAPVGTDLSNPNRVYLIDVTAFPDPTTWAALPALVTTNVAPDGTFGSTSPFRPLLPLSDGVHKLVVRISDVAGNITYSDQNLTTTTTPDPLVVTIDTIPPNTVPTLALNAADDTGKVGDNITVVRRPRFVGVGESRQTIELVQVDPANPDTVLAVLNSTIALVDGTYTVQMPADLNNGRIVLRTRVLDAAGNHGPLSSPLTIQIVSLADDYDNDGKSDPAVYRSASSLWTVAQSTLGSKSLIFAGGGSINDVPLDGDLDGDGKADFIIYRANTSQFLANRTSLGVMPTAGLGYANLSIPVLADYDSDGRTDLAAFTQTASLGGSALWSLLQSSTGQRVDVRFGVALSAGDKLIPVAGDYDGDRIIDLAVYHSTTGQWDISQSSTGTVRTVAGLGGAGVAAPVPGDYDGDGMTDPAVWNPSTAVWTVRYSSTGQTTSVHAASWKANDVAVPGDYDGDNRTDMAVYRPSTGQYIIRNSGGGGAVKVPGLPNDLPIQATYAYLRSRGASQLLPSAPKAGVSGVGARVAAVGLSTPVGSTSSAATGTSSTTAAAGTAGTRVSSRPAVVAQAVTPTPSGLTAAYFSFRRNRLVLINAGR